MSIFFCGVILIFQTYTFRKKFGRQDNVTTQVASLRASLADAAPNNVVDMRRGDAVATDDLVDDQGSEVSAVPVLQRSIASAPGSAYSIHNISIEHSFEKRGNNQSIRLTNKQYLPGFFWFFLVYFQKPFTEFTT